MKRTNDKLAKHLQEAFFSASPITKFDFECITLEMTDVDLLRFLKKAAKTMFSGQKNFFNGTNSGPYILGEDSYKVLSTFDKIIYEEYGKEEGSKLINNFYSL